MKKFKLIYADPPWEYGNTVSNGAAENHYPTMKLEDIKRLPVWSLADDDAVLAMWYTGNHVLEATEVAESWGFRVRQHFLFTWVKWTEMAERTVNAALGNQELTDFYDFLDLANKITRMNGGNYSRQNQESVLVAVRGRGVERINASVKQVIYSPLDEHSSKPGEARFRLEQLYGEVPRIELFARDSAPGWDVWGNDCESTVELLPPMVTRVRRGGHEQAA
ncbi:MT-A70 family methyltransferase [Pectobacterium parmentieri]|uniref:MT-A70 family methyltransferase n=1 Tax=Pectobacterium parmentieri TaxID=1905730 RepID=UPI000D618B49|nr:MT-A70 family methyltransferase [Pectobacterium parmentieri]PWD66524.1 DNA methyltransferase [Pectobacterium parmentieri]